MNLLLASICMFHYVTAPVATMRESPSETSEIVSQSYYSEPIGVIEEKDDWTKIETLVDQYQGWINSNQLCHRNVQFPSSDSAQIAKVNRCMAHLYHVQDTIYGPIATVPYESTLEVLEEIDGSNGRWIKVLLVDGREVFVQRGDVVINPKLTDLSQMPLLAFKFLNLPYTWGGRSSLGFDCSGYVQMLYRQAGVNIPRDSRSQAEWAGFKEITIEEIKPGDLVFFGLDENRIRHVGMLVRKNLFIHATIAENAPYIHISNLTHADWNGTGKWPYRTARTLKNRDL